MVSDYMEIYKSHDGWRWRLKAPNHETLASGEGYVTKWGVKRAAKRIAPAAEIVERREPW